MALPKKEKKKKNKHKFSNCTPSNMVLKTQIDTNYLTSNTLCNLTLIKLFENGSKKRGYQKKINKDDSIIKTCSYIIKFFLTFN